MKKKGGHLKQLTGEESRKEGVGSAWKPGLPACLPKPFFMLPYDSTERRAACEEPIQLHVVPHRFKPTVPLFARIVPKGTKTLNERGSCLLTEPDKIQRAAMIAAMQSSASNDLAALPLCYSCRAFIFDNESFRSHYDAASFQLESSARPSAGHSTPHMQTLRVSHNVMFSLPQQDDLLHPEFW